MALQAVVLHFQWQLVSLNQFFKKNHVKNKKAKVKKKKKNPSQMIASGLACEKLPICLIEKSDLSS